MVYFQGQDWLLQHGHSHWEACIEPKHQKPEDVRWDVDMSCIVGGVPWRRVPQEDRPRLELTLSGIRNPGRLWTDLGKLDYWNWEDEEEDYSLAQMEAGWRPHMPPSLDITHHGKKDEGWKLLQMVQHIWRVVKREGAGFFIELAADDQVHSLLEQSLQMEKALSTGEAEEPERPEVNPDFWRQNATLYLLEEVRFGQVRVTVPRNVRDPIAYAQKRAQDLLGVKGPAECIEAWDLYDSNQEFKDIYSDLYLHLHYHGEFHNR